MLGLVIATGVDRCNTRRKEAATLQDYYTAIRADLEQESRSNQLNIGDAENDVASLDNAVHLLASSHTDSLVRGIEEVTNVMAKGVFRTFSPTTFDVMVNTDDISLIEDLELRSDLAAVFAFRTNIIEQDLHDYNDRVLQTLDGLAAGVDLRCILNLTVTAACIRSTAALTASNIDALLILQLVAHSRLFHLRMGQEQVVEMIERMDTLITR